jgi:hypothetical protein
LTVCFPSLSLWTNSTCCVGTMLCQTSVLRICPCRGSDCKRMDLRPCSLEGKSPAHYSGLSKLGFHPRVMPALIAASIKASSRRRWRRSSNRVATVARGSPSCQSSAASASMSPSVGRGRACALIIVLVNKFQVFGGFIAPSA